MTPNEARDATEIDEPSASIQWKGTQVCADAYCVCGDSFHIDAEFAYYVRCPACKRVFAMSPWVKMVEIDEAAIEGPHSIHEGFL